MRITLWIGLKPKQNLLAIGKKVLKRFGTLKKVPYLCTVNQLKQLYYGTVLQAILTFF